MALRLEVWALLCYACTCAGDEAKSVIAMLRILPELDVAVVEDIGMWVQVVEALWREDHAHIITGVKQWQGLQEEVRVGCLQSTQQCWSSTNCCTSLESTLSLYQQAARGTSAALQCCMGALSSLLLLLLCMRSKKTDQAGVGWIWPTLPKFCKGLHKQSSSVERGSEDMGCSLDQHQKYTQPPQAG